MADGYILEIPESVLNKLGQADEAIKKLAKTSSETRDMVVSSFKSMADGVDPFLLKLKESKEALSNIITKNTNSGINQTANSLSKVSTLLNKINSDSSAKKSVSEWQGLNESIKTQQQRLTELNRQIKEYELTMSRINTGKGGTVSRSDAAAYDANMKEANSIRQTIALYEEKQRKIIAYQQEQKRMADLIAQTTGQRSFSDEKKIAELKLLNEAYRNGVSELQKKAKAEDEAANSAKKEAAALEKVAKAQQKKNEAAAKQKNADIAKQNREAEKALESYNKALTRSENTIAQRISKIDALQRAQARLTATGRDYSVQISRIKSETERLKKANDDVTNSTERLRTNQSRVLDTSAQLQRKLGLIFSVSAIEGYIRKMIQLRGEFELQHRSLQAIIGDKEKADAVWNKTIALAVKSPFTIKELVSYTKQLAAYRIETDKLYETNKMLADVSAGLGVDMQRLILAYGQVKAANYLRGTELRQFTEAGVNILGELSEYFTKLKGELVSVGDVFDMVSKRMVKFEDVANVFKKITSEGGIFYNMQEIQAETLKGQIANLQDSLDVMLNDIGKANDGILKDFVGIVRTIIVHWEEFANILVAAGTAFAFYAAKITFAAIATNGFSVNAGKAMIAAGGLSKSIGRVGVALSSIKNFASGNIFTLLIAGVSFAISEFITLRKRVQEVKGEYDILTDSITKQKQEFENISQEMKKYEENIKSSSKKMASLKEGTDEYTDAQKENNEASSKRNALLEELKTKFPEIYAGLVRQKDGTIDLKKAQEEYNLALEKTNYLNWIAKQTGGLFSNNLKEDIEKYNENLSNSNKLSSDLENSWKLITGRIKVYMSTNKHLTEEFKKQVNDILNSSENIHKKISDLQMLGVGRGRGEVNIGDYNRIVRPLEKISRDATDANKALEESTESLSKKIKQVATDYKNSTDIISEAGKDAASKGLGTFIESLGIPVKEVKDFVSEKFEAELGVKINPKTVISQYQGIQKEIKEYVEKHQLSIDIIAADQGAGEYFKKLKEDLKDAESDIYKLKTATEQINPNKTNKEALEIEEKRKKEIIQILKAYGEYSTLKKEESSELKRLKEQISLLKKIGEEYKNNLKYYSKEEALAKTIKDYSSAFDAAGFRKGFLDNMQLDPAGIISALEEIGKTAGPAMKVHIEKALSDLRGDLEVNTKVQNIEEAKKEIESLFGKYELTVEVEKLGLDKSLIKQLFDVDAISIDDIKKKLSEMFPDISKLSGEQLKLYKETQKKIINIQKKDLENQFKEYSNYLKKTVSARALAEIELQQEIAKIRENEVLTEPQKKHIIEEKTKETRAKQSAIDWREFKESEVYLQLFEKLEYKATSVLSVMRDSLDNLRESMSELTPEQLKTINEYYSKLDDELTERNPLDSYKKAMAEIKDLKEQGKDEDSLSEDLLIYNSQAEALKLQISDIETIIGLKEKNISLDSIDEEILKRNKELTGLTVDELRKLNNIKQSDLSGINSKISITSKDLKSFDKARNSVDKLGRRFDKISDIGQKAFESISTILEDIGVESDSTGAILSNMSMSLLDMVMQAIMFSLQMKVMKAETELFGKTLTAAMGPIGWAMIALQALTSIFSAFTKIHDNKKQKEIDAEKEKVEQLEKAYNKLEKAIESAYSLDTLKKSNDLAQKNIDSQIESRKAMIAAEKEKKKTDQDQIKEWQNEIEELNEKSKELKKQLITDVGGFGQEDDIKSAAEDFTSAWLDAFNETGDGLAGLEENMDDWIQNMVKKQLMLRLSQKFIEPVIDKLNDMFEKDSKGGEELLTEELDAFRRVYDQKAAQFNEEAKRIMKELNINPSSGSDTELTGLQQGIQSITEETAQALEALLNSMRSYVSDSNIQLRSIVSLLGFEPDMNPMLSELRIQTKLITSINNLFSSVIYPGHRLGSSGLKVFMD